VVLPAPLGPAITYAVGCRVGLAMTRGLVF
jgi:hypothetical protein